MSEKLVTGSLVGPVNRCIIGEQFSNYMRGDRFFYRNCGLPWSFTKEQQRAIYQTSVAWIFCAVGDDISAMPRDTFQKPSKSNPIVPCQKIQKLDLSPWIEN